MIYFKANKISHRFLEDLRTIGNESSKSFSQDFCKDNRPLLPEKLFPYFAPLKNDLYEERACSFCPGTWAPGLLRKAEEF